MNDAATSILRRFADRGALYDALTLEIAGIIRAAVAARRRASIAVPGGSTPLPLFERLRELDLPWSAVCVTLTDERWIDTREEASNERQLRAQLLRDRASRATVVGLKSAAADPSDAIATCTAALERIGLPLDAVILGMGGDGHVASLFPGAPGLEAALDPLSRVRCVAVTPPAHAVAPGNRRLSLTLATLVATRRLLLIATGEPKRALIERALGLAGEHAVAELPVTAVIAQAITPAEAWWAP